MPTLIYGNILFLGLLGITAVQAKEAVESRREDRRLSPQQYIQQLNDDNYHKRVRATRTLEEMGFEALPALQAVRNHADPEVRRRVQKLLRQLEIQSRLAPKRVTLNMQRQTTQRILDELSKQTGYKIKWWGNIDDGLVYTMREKDIPFWQALDKVCQFSGMSLQPLSFGDEYLRLIKQDRYSPYVCYEGAFRFAAQGFHFYRNVDLSSLARQQLIAQCSERLDFTFAIFAEPRLPILNVGSVEVTAAFDNENRSLVSVAADNPIDPDVPGRFPLTRYHSGTYRGFYQVTVPLCRPSEQSRVAKLIKGTVPLTLLVERKPALITGDLLRAKGKKNKAGKTNINIDEIKHLPATKQYELKLSISEETADGSLDYTWLSSLQSRFEIQDAKGNPFPLYSNGWSGINGNKVQITFTCGPVGGDAKLAEPSKLIYYLWETALHQVHFEFKDLPLP